MVCAWVLTAVCAVCAVLTCCAWLPTPLISALTAPETLIVPFGKDALGLLIGARERIGVVAGAAGVALHREDVARGRSAADLHLPSVEADVAARGVGKAARAVDGVGRRGQELNGGRVEQIRVRGIDDRAGADGGGAGVGVGRRGLDRAGGGEAGRVRQRDAQGSGRLRRRLNQKLIARRRGSRQHDG